MGRKVGNLHVATFRNGGMKIPSPSNRRVAVPVIGNHGGAWRNDARDEATQQTTHQRAEKRDVVFAGITRPSRTRRLDRRKLAAPLGGKFMALNRTRARTGLGPS